MENGDWGGGGGGDSPDRSQGNRPSHDIQHVQNPRSTNAKYGGYNSKKDSVTSLSTSAFFHEKSAPTPVRFFATHPSVSVTPVSKASSEFNSVAAGNHLSFILTMSREDDDTCQKFEIENLSSAHFLSIPFR